MYYYFSSEINPLEHTSAEVREAGDYGENIALRAAKKVWSPEGAILAW